MFGVSENKESIILLIIPESWPDTPLAVRWHSFSNFFRDNPASATTLSSAGASKRLTLREPNAQIYCRCKLPVR